MFRSAPSVVDDFDHLGDRDYVDALCDDSRWCRMMYFDRNTVSNTESQDREPERFH